MRIATDQELSPFAGSGTWLEGYRAEMLAHPTAGRCLRNYAALTDYPEAVGRLVRETLARSREAIAST